MKPIHIFLCLLAGSSIVFAIKEYKQQNAFYCTCTFKNVQVKHNPALDLYALKDTSWHPHYGGRPEVWATIHMGLNDEHQALEWFSTPQEEFTWSDSCRAKKWLYKFRKNEEEENKIREAQQQKENQWQ